MRDDRERRLLIHGAGAHRMIGTTRCRCRFSLVCRGHPPARRRDLRNCPNKTEHIRHIHKSTTQDSVIEDDVWCWCVGRETEALQRRSSHHRREAPDETISPDARTSHPSHVRLRPCFRVPTPAGGWRRRDALQRGRRSRPGWATRSGASGRAFRVQEDAHRLLPAAAAAFLPRGAGEGGDVGFVERDESVRKGWVYNCVGAG